MQWYALRGGGYECAGYNRMKFGGDESYLEGNLWDKDILGRPVWRRSAGPGKGTDGQRNRVPWIGKE